jgi:hypothetical protein
MKTDYCLNNRYTVVIRPYLYIISKTVGLRDIMNKKFRMLLSGRDV